MYLLCDLKHIGCGLQMLGVLTVHNTVLINKKDCTYSLRWHPDKHDKYITRKYMHKQVSNEQMSTQNLNDLDFEHWRSLKVKSDGVGFPIGV